MNQFRHYIYVALSVLAGAFAVSCSDEDDPDLTSHYDFMEISGDSVISRQGLQMVASTLYTEGDTSYVSSQVTVSTHMFDLSFAFKGKSQGTYPMLDTLGVVAYRELLPDSTGFKYTNYKILNGTVEWTGDDRGENHILLKVDLQAAKYVVERDTFIQLHYPTVNFKGSINAVRNNTK